MNSNRHQQYVHKHNVTHQSGFTIVELLIVIIVIGILMTIAVTSYLGIQARAHDAERMQDISSIARAVELYKVKTGSYPQTTNNPTTDGSDGAITDSNCGVGTQTAEWVPGLTPDIVPRLPQSTGNQPNGPGSGCYKYWSNGEDYIISAWLAVTAGPNDGTMYRRVGFGDASTGTASQYYCNDLAAVGADEVEDAYKYSFTISNITTCDETPPAPDDGSGGDEIGGCDGAGGEEYDGICVPKNVLDYIADTYPTYDIYRVDDDGGEYEIRTTNGNDDYRFEYNSAWELQQITH